jgi:hypothetical protein
MLSGSRSNTSSDNIQYHDEHGENLLIQNFDKSLHKNKIESTDTDFHLNMLANPNKIVSIKKTLSESSELNIIDNISESSKSNSSKKSSNIISDNIKINTESKSIFDKIQNIRQSPTNKYQPPIQQIPIINTPIPIPVPIIAQESYKSDNNISALYNNTNNIKQLTQQEIRMKKIEMLRKLSEIKLKGYQLSKEYDFNSDLEEMEYEYELLKSFADKRNGVKIFKRGLLQAVSVFEFLNDKYDPFDFQLSGWGEHVNVEIDSWEDILEEIYEKYKGSGKKMGPEIKLMYFIIASASAFHFTKSYSSKLPGLDSVLASNPDLLSKIMNQQPQKQQFMTPQELNIEKQKNELREKDKLLKEQNNKMNNRSTYDSSKSNTYEPVASNIKPPTGNKLFNIQAPDKVKDILNRIHNIPSTIKNNSDTQDDVSSNNDRLISETTMSDNNKKKKKIVKKSNISIY